MIKLYEESELKRLTRNLKEKKILNTIVITTPIYAK